MQKFVVGMKVRGQEKKNYTDRRVFSICIEILVTKNVFIQFLGDHFNLVAEIDLTDLEEETEIHQVLQPPMDQQ